MFISGDGNALCDKTRISLPREEVGGKERACAKRQSKNIFAAGRAEREGAGMRKATKARISFVSNLQAKSNEKPLH